MKYGLISSILFLISVFAGAQCLPQHSLDKESIAFKSGEKITFSIHYRWGFINSDVASATLSLENVMFNGDSVYCARVYGRSAKKFDAFFKLRRRNRQRFK